MRRRRRLNDLEHKLSIAVHAVCLAFVVFVAVWIYIGAVG